MNMITAKEFAENKNREFTVISFNKDGERKLSYSGIGVVKAVMHMIEEQKGGRRCVILDSLSDSELINIFEKDIYDNEEGNRV